MGFFFFCFFAHQILLSSDFIPFSSYFLFGRRKRAKQKWNDKACCCFIIPWALLLLYIGFNLHPVCLKLEFRLRQAWNTCRRVPMQDHNGKTIQPFLADSVGHVLLQQHSISTHFWPSLV